MIKMTEKRFILVEYVNKGLFIQDNADDETQYFQGSKSSLEKVVDLLNSLTDENEQLKKDCTVLIHHNQEYRKENEQLKADKQALIDFIKKEFPKSHKHILEGFND